MYFSLAVHRNNIHCEHDNRHFIYILFLFFQWFVVDACNFFFIVLVCRFCRTVTCGGSFGCVTGNVNRSLRRACDVYTYELIYFANIANRK